MIYFSADTHFWHKKILIHQYSTRGQFLTPDDRSTALELIATNRQKEFAPSIESIETMNDYLLEQINQTVGVDDTLWMLGDFCLSDGNRMRKIFDAIRCKDVRMIWGNHDWKPDVLRDCKFREHYDSTLLFEFNQEPGRLYTESEVFDSKELTRKLEKKYKETQKLYLSHYCSLTYPLKARSWHLYGHSHGILPVAYQTIPSMDVGVDAVEMYNAGFEPLTPVSWNQVKKFMQDRINLSPDTNYIDVASAACGMDYDRKYGNSIKV